MTKHLPARARAAALAALFAFSAFAASALAQSPGEFFRAIKSDNASAMRELLDQGMDPNTRDERGRPGLFVALQEESMKAADALMASPHLRPDEPNASGETPLMMAALKGQLDVARRLIAQGAAVNKTGWTPLHYAASSGHMPMLELLLEHHADLNAPSPNGTTPLMMAAGYGSPEAVQRLLKAGADAQLRNQKGMTALDFARRYERPDARAILQKVKKQSTPPAQRGQW